MKNKEREIRQESDLSAKYGKARQDVGLFYYLNLVEHNQNNGQYRNPGSMRIVGFMKGEKY